MSIALYLWKNFICVIEFKLEWMLQKDVNDVKNIEEFSDN